MTVYLIRHAQSAFNAVYDPNKPDPMIFDAPITELGETQAQQARSEVKHLDLVNVIVSPFTRTLQTAHLIFGNRVAVSDQFCSARTTLQQLRCRKSPTQLARDYPHLDFDHLDDCWWHDGEKDHRGISVEPEDVLQERADRFVDFLKRENIHSTAIVSHGNFIHALTGIKPKNCEVIEFNPH